MAPIGNAVFATLLMNDAYLPGAMVLGHSLRDRGAKAKLVVLVTVDNVSAGTITELKTVFDDIIPVQQMQNKQPANLYVMNRPDLIATFTKIELWRQTQYKRIVYFDADMVCLRAPHELLRLDTAFAAAPDIGWPDCFNSGMMVLNPNMGDYYALLALAQRGISFDGADQGLLNMHFRDWERVSFAYNCTPSANYQYLPAYRHFQSSISAVHFIGKDKPWTLGRENKHNHGVYGELLGRWWAVYDAHYRPQTSAYHSGQSLTAPKKVQDYVRGEESQFVPGYSSYQPATSGQQQQPLSSGQSQIPSVAVHPPPYSSATKPLTEQAMGDAPDSAEKAAENDFTPTPTVVQRRFSAPHAEWEPARAPPPQGSKPEASNFPQHVQYDFNSDKELFQPPEKYPEAPKGMWYELPPRPAEPQKPKPIFPWESKAPKATRVFAQPKTPTPPSEPEVEPEPDPASSTATSTTLDPEPAETPTMTSPDPWAGFQARTNAWDEIPEIEKYMQALQGPRKAKVQVLHNTATPQTRSPKSERRQSLRLTDFPTEIERPSLPVTPAPIRRPSFWGEERDEQGNLPAAEGVPKQEEWNPIAKLEELQRRQSEVLAAPAQLEEAPSVPARSMPESESKEAAIEAAQQATAPPVQAPKALKPILKAPSFEVPPKENVDADDLVSPTEVRGHAAGKQETAPEPTADPIGSGGKHARLNSTPEVVPIA